MAKKTSGKDNWNWKMLERLGLDGTDADFDKNPCYSRRAGRDSHGRPVIVMPRHLLVNDAPRVVEQ